MATERKRFEDSVGSNVSEADDDSLYSMDYDIQPSWFSGWFPEIRKYILQPFFIGTSAAFGMSVGYALFDSVSSVLFSRTFRLKSQ
mmetsp:Transcript_1639/g.2913  ORF Transcript_1639/g.2913 Transcript_1639/m.2913 type:complete len:86 (-) Transcript_1639:178-435(-)|eukprot:CAMPEP_0182443664 /NCGR_PEP_ID=MMETSP1172-20130603/2345_1 /TAXON_ID=708627 /ORGANISM="Timspurckia oligopyrenoides, Strain CCMP3278" /LENGTH=85 /DNA_ID=CAMNT_0024639017 /DNA_START=42 /DNA_END=299 /DNA_ORIENTATION=-